MTNEDVQALRRAEIERLSELQDFTSHRPSHENGVLLSDRIKQYCIDYKLIDPFDEHVLLRPAGYDLTVGNFYAIGDDVSALREGMEFSIEPYQVAVIETFETLNLPRFLIGRWNIRVQLAYSGLLWVGGAQVDPGFRGRLACPIYNLSTKPVPLKYRQRLAMIDFVTTTPVNPESRPFPWAGRRSIVFQEYDRLKSGVAAKLDDFQETISRNESTTLASIKQTTDHTDRRLDDARSRVDQFITLILVVLGILFAGLGIVATKGAEEPNWANSSIWIASVAFVVALASWVHSRSTRKGRIWEGALVALVAFLFCLGAIFAENRLDIRSGVTGEIDHRVTVATTRLTEAEDKLRLREHRAENERLYRLERQVEALRRAARRK